MYNLKRKVVCSSRRRNARETGSFHSQINIFGSVKSNGTNGGHDDEHAKRHGHEKLDDMLGSIFEFLLLLFVSRSVFGSGSISAFARRTNHRHVRNGRGRSAVGLRETETKYMTVSEPSHGNHRVSSRNQYPVGVLVRGGGRDAGVRRRPLPVVVADVTVHQTGQFGRPSSATLATVTAALCRCRCFASLIHSEQLSTVNCQPLTIVRLAAGELRSLYFGILSDTIAFIDYFHYLACCVR